MDYKILFSIMREGEWNENENVQDEHLLEYSFKNFPKERKKRNKHCNNVVAIIDECYKEEF